MHIEVNYGTININETDDLYLKDENGDYILDKDGNYIIERHVSFAYAENLQKQITELHSYIEELQKQINELRKN